MNKTYRMHVCRPGLLLGIALACSVAAPAHATHPAHAPASDDHHNVITAQAEDRDHVPHALPAALMSLVVAHQSVTGAYAGAIVDEALCRADTTAPHALN